MISQRSQLITRGIHGGRTSFAQARTPQREAASVLDFGLPRLAFYLGLASLGLLTFRPALGLTFSDLLFLISFSLTLAVLLLSRKPFGRLEQGMLAGAVVYSLGALASAFGNESSLSSLLVVARLLFLVVGWVWLATVVLRTRGEVKTAATVWVLSVGASGVAAVVQLLAGDVVPGSTTSWGRMTGFTTHPNDLGGSCAVALVTGMYLVQRDGSAFRRIILLAAVLACACGVILSGSVSGMLGSAIAVTGLVLTTQKGWRKGIAIALLVGCGAAILSLQGDYGGTTASDRIRVTTQDGGSLSSRLLVAEQALDRILENPLLGVGPLPGGTPIEDGGNVVHNIFMASWYESGVLGFFGLATVVLATARAARKTLAQSDDQDRDLAHALTWSFIAYLVFAFAQPTFYVRYGWIPVALLAAMLTRALVQVRPTGSTARNHRQSPR